MDLWAGFFLHNLEWHASAGDPMMCPTCGGDTAHCSRCGTFQTSGAHVRVTGDPPRFVVVNPPLGSLNATAPMQLCEDCYERLCKMVWEWLYGGPGLEASVSPWPGLRSPKGRP